MTGEFGLDQEAQLRVLAAEQKSLKKRLLVMEAMFDDIYGRFVPPAHYCPICEQGVRVFLPFGSKGRRAQCPHCRSIDRNRLLYLYLNNRTDIFSAQNRLLHIAPEKALAEKFSVATNIDYLPVDLNADRAMVVEAVDIQDMKYENSSFDYIICSHVLEHVPDDRRAMREMYRVLKPAGHALLMVPLRKGSKETVEDSAHDTPELRRRHYGSEEHLRYYGLDFVDRLQEAGFEVRKEDYAQVIGDEAERLGLSREWIFVCSK